MFQDDWIVVNEVPTHVCTWGGWIEDEITSDSIILCLTGNPGLPDFYYVFLSTLHSLTNIPVWAVNFAGTEMPPPDTGLPLPSLNRNPQLYDLIGQVDHKEDFIRRFVPPGKKVYLVGHSVGGKIAVELMKREGVVKERLKKAFLIFPTLEWIAKTRNGFLVMNFFRHLIPVTLWLVQVFSLLPHGVQTFLLKIYFCLRAKGEKVDKCCMDGVFKLLNYKSLKGVFFLAMDEMHKIKDLDKEVLESLGERIHCYYSRSDGWAPLDHRENLKRLCPSVKTTVVEDHIMHAFVLDTPREVAAKISEEINNPD